MQHSFRLMNSLASILLAATFGFFMNVTSAAAQEGEHNDAQKPPMHREPPPQAYEACKGKAEGDKLTITTPHGEVGAVCATSPKGLFARPLHKPNDQGDPEHKGPPPVDGKGPEGRGPEGRGPEGRGPEGRGPEGRGPEGRGPEGRGPEGKDGPPPPRGEGPPPPHEESPPKI